MSIQTFCPATPPALFPTFRRLPSSFSSPSNTGASPPFQHHQGSLVAVQPFFPPVHFLSLFFILPSFFFLSVFVVVRFLPQFAAPQYAVGITFL